MTLKAFHPAHDRSGHRRRLARWRGMDQWKRPAVLLTSRLVHAGREEDFGRWAERFDQAARRSAGGRDGLRLEQPNGLMHFVHRFDSEESARRWRDSGERRRLGEEADAFSVEHSEIAVGDGIRLRLPSEAVVPKWKSWLATWLMAFPLILGVNAALNAVASGLPQIAQVAISSLILTVALTWFILPKLRKLLRPWLFRDGEHGTLKKEPG